MLGWMMFINLYAQIDLDQSIEIPIDIDLLHNLPHKYAPTTTIFINLKKNVLGAPESNIKVI